MKKLTITAISLICLLNAAFIFEQFNYLETNQFKQWLENNKPMIIVDIQVKDEFTAHHFPGSLETNAYPVKTDAQRAQLDVAVKSFKDTANNVVVVCPRGGGGAKRTYSYMKSQGVPEEKLTILRGGVEKWPYSDLLVKK